MKKAMIFVCFLMTCFLMVGCTVFTGQKVETTNAVKVEKEETVSTEKVDKDKAAIQAILVTEFTGVNTEYIKLENDLMNKSLELSKTTGGQYSLEGTPEQTAYNEFIKKKFEPYLTKSFYEAYTKNAMAFSNQVHYLQKSITGDEMKMEDLQIDVDKDDPTFYHFSFKVILQNPDGKSTEHKVKGMAICPEEGKIGKLTQLEDGGLNQQIRMNTDEL